MWLLPTVNHTSCNIPHNSCNVSCGPSCSTSGAFCNSPHPIFCACRNIPHHISHTNIPKSPTKYVFAASAILLAWLPTLANFPPGLRCFQSNLDIITMLASSSSSQRISRRAATFTVTAQCGYLCETRILILKCAKKKKKNHSNCVKIWLKIRPQDHAFPVMHFAGTISTMDWNRWISQ